MFGLHNWILERRRLVVPTIDIDLIFDIDQIEIGPEDIGL
jgi:hypothetical protein